MNYESSTLRDECPSARRSTVQSRALHLACRMLGDAAHLAKYLGVSEEQLLTWLQARDDPPREAFLKVVDVILSQWEARDDVMCAARKH